MQHLTLHGREIHSLGEIREYFDLGELSTAVLNHTLEDWLNSCFYESEAQRVRELREREKARRSRSLDFMSAMRSDTNDVRMSFAGKRELCEVFGISYADTGDLSAEQRADCERKQSELKKHTDDPDILARALQTATNQTELAQLIEDEYKTIQLCGGSFTVPIRVGGIHYIGIGNPKMEAPFTEEQYRRAGVTFEGISLPEEADERASDQARSAAADYGFDDYYERHSEFAAVVHERLKRGPVSGFFNLNADGSDVMSEYYHHKSEAESEMKRVVNAAYDEASEIFIPGKSTCLANHAAKDYARWLKGKLTPIIERLSHTNAAAAQINQLSKLCESAEHVLLEQFFEELNDSSGFYKMYDRRYFLEKPEIENLGEDMEYTESFILNGLIRAIQGDNEYVISGLIETISELEDDVNSRAGTFYASAHTLFKKYCEQIEEIAEEIGKDLSGDELSIFKSCQNAAS